MAGHIDSIMTWILAVEAQTRIRRRGRLLFVIHTLFKSEKQ